MKKMTETQIKKIVLRTLLELLEDTNNYSPDRWEDDFRYVVTGELRKLMKKRGDKK